MLGKLFNKRKGTRDFFTSLDWDEQDRLVEKLDRWVDEGSFTWQDIKTWDTETLGAFYNEHVKRAPERKCCLCDTKGNDLVIYEGVDEKGERYWFCDCVHDHGNYANGVLTYDNIKIPL